MKLLVDACAGQRLANRLRQAGHDVDFAVDWPRNADWGVCGNPKSPRCGLLTFEHQGSREFEAEKREETTA